MKSVYLVPYDYSISCLIMSFFKSPELDYKNALKIFGLEGTSKIIQNFLLMFSIGNKKKSQGIKYVL